MITSLRIAITLPLCAFLILARALQILVWVPWWLALMIRTRSIAPPHAPTVPTTST